MIAALASAGLPPFGVGLYVRDAVPRGPVPWRWVAVNAWRSDAGQQVADARAQGQPAWLYGTPEHFRPDTWRAGLAYLLARAVELGAVGIIPDPEGGWPDISEDSRARELGLFGTALSAAAMRTRVGVTAYPLLPGLEHLARAAGDRVWGSPQIYGRTSQDPADFAQWWRRWEALFGPRLVPSIAGWQAHLSQATPTGYRAYLNRLPHAGGAIVWALPGGPPAYMRAELAAYQPGGSMIGTLMLAARTLLARPIMLAAIGAFVAIVAIAAVVSSKGV